jgi:AraC family transcriptional regulator, regulatory protein of adaptative response / methylphosphotriester-DNA alkyltransferase methyltransferase
VLRFSSNREVLEWLGATSNESRGARSSAVTLPGVSTYVPTQRASTVRLRTSLFHEANDIVEREFASDLSLDDIARRVASSRRQLQRAYAEIGNSTFRDHLTQVRMRKAAEMLATRSLTVREVAHRVGYRQPAQFAKAFRRYQGVAPSDFRASGANVATPRFGRPEPASEYGFSRFGDASARA